MQKMIHVRTEGNDKKLIYPSADRNSKPIGDAFLAQVDRETENLQLLEISSGSGQHVGHLAPLCPNITFQPTEYDKELFSSIRAYAADCPSKNIREPLFVDISKQPSEWQETSSLKPASFDYMYNANMMHITPWICSEGLFRAAGYFLKPHGTLFTYGPYAVNGILLPESNINFDQSLKSRNSEWGIRDIIDLKRLAKENGLELRQTQEMPSNNKFLTWVKL